MDNEIRVQVMKDDQKLSITIDNFKMVISRDDESEFEFYFGGYLRKQVIDFLIDGLLYDDTAGEKVISLRNNNWNIDKPSHSGRELIILLEPKIPYEMKSWYIRMYLKFNSPEIIVPFMMYNGTIHETDIRKILYIIGKKHDVDYRLKEYDESRTKL